MFRLKYEKENKTPKMNILNISDAPIHKNMMRNFPKRNSHVSNTAKPEKENDDIKLTEFLEKLNTSEDLDLLDIRHKKRNLSR